MLRSSSRNCAGVSFAVAFLASASSALAAMPAAEQTQLVQKYCAVCHNDAHVNGGLTLEHFDAAHVDPGIAAMLASKLTGGVLLKTVLAGQTDAEAAAMVDRHMKTGAMGASGVRVPDAATQAAFVTALAAAATGAGTWMVTEDQSGLTASMFKEVPSAGDPNTANTYRLRIECRPAAQDTQMTLTWAPGVPNKDAMMSGAADGTTLFQYSVEGSELMFTGAGGTSGTGATIVYASRQIPRAPVKTMQLPRQTLAFTNLFPGETVVFPFDKLPPDARAKLSACFGHTQMADRR